MHAWDTAPVPARTGREEAAAVLAATNADAATYPRCGNCGGVGWRGGGQVWDVFSLRVLGSNGGDAGVGGLAGFREGVVA